MRLLRLPVAQRCSPLAATALAYDSIASRSANWPNTSAKVRNASINFEWRGLRRGGWRSIWIWWVNAGAIERAWNCRAFSGMLPNQKEVLRSPGDLQRDGGVSKQLKEVCDEIGLDVRSQLLLDGLTDFVESEA